MNRPICCVEHIPDILSVDKLWCAFCRNYYCFVCDIVALNSEALKQYQEKVKNCNEICCLNCKIKK